ncbi:MAG TPA: hypothetical protein VGE27_08530 [Gemmatimonas sp.]|uniref:hypothetical protein n=1 Tax=Gemmatimonas sp. TaxID=1962908 RepID=UPI002ED8FC05
MNAPPASVSEDVLQTDTQPVVPNLPDRADAPVSEVTERFLRAVIAEIPVERIEELHLFSPLRQGTLETGIAVIALRAVAPVAQADGEPSELAPELPFAEAQADVDVIGTDDAIEVEAIEVASTDDVIDEDDIAEETIIEDAVIEDAVIDEAPIDELSVEDVVIEDVAIDDAIVEAIDVADADDESPYADEPSVIDAEVLDAPVVDALEMEDVHIPDATGTPAEDLEVAVVAAPAPRPERHTVYTARYRYIIKGPERGKWESSVKAEAEAPLITVETVVRGVQRRAGEESEIVRYSGAQIARALRIPLA